MNQSNTNFSPRVATAVIIANMIGTGVFTSLGFQLLDLGSGFVLLALWAVGGLAAFCGALCYAELGASFPRSGGEYNFLSKTLHPSLGFVSGWISATIGFAAPTALVAITFGKYLQHVVPGVHPTVSACLLVVTVAAVHSSSHKYSGGLQWAFTLLKIGLILITCLLALVISAPANDTNFSPFSPQITELGTGAFAVALIYVSYAYSGWNAATYFSGELEHPQRSLPKILAIGTAVVTCLYILINYTFLAVAPQDAMRGELDIVFVVAQYAFGDSVARVVSLFLSLLLVSSASAMILAAPRVLQMIGQDFSVFKWLALTNRNQIPFIAIMTQAAIALLLIVTATFESILVFSGFALALNTLAAIVGLMVYRWKEPDAPRAYRVWAYPLTPLVFISITVWTLIHIAIQRPKEAGAGIIIVIAGLATWWVINRLGQGASGGDQHIS